MGNHEIKFRGPVVLNPKMFPKLQDPKMSLWKSVLKPETGRETMSAMMVLSAKNEGKEEKIGHILFADINTVTKSAALNFKASLRSNLNNGVLTDFKNLFEPDCFLKPGNAIFVKGEYRNENFVDDLFRLGMLHMVISRIDSVVVCSKNPNRELLGAETGVAVPLSNRIILQPQVVVAQNKGYLDAVVMR